MAAEKKSESALIMHPRHDGRNYAAEHLASVSPGDIVRIVRAEVLDTKRNVYYIRSKEMLDHIMTAHATSFSSARDVGVDLEMDPRSHAPRILSLCTATECLVVDLAAVCQLHPFLCGSAIPLKLASLLQSRNIRKYGASLETDIQFLSRHRYSILVQPADGGASDEMRPLAACNIVDLQTVWRLFGISENLPSLEHMASIVLGLKMDKKERLSDWSKGDLTDDQLRYAAIDAFAGLEIGLKMKTWMKHGVREKHAATYAALRAAAPQRIKIHIPAHLAEAVEQKEAAAPVPPLYKPYQAAADEVDALLVRLNAVQAAVAVVRKEAVALKAPTNRETSTYTAALADLRLYEHAAQPAAAPLRGPDKDEEEDKVTERIAQIQDEASSLVEGIPGGPEPAKKA